MNKIVIVTGVSSGLGKAFAVALLQAGFKVVGTVRSQDAAEEFERLQSGAAFARVLDVTDDPRAACRNRERDRAEPWPRLRAHQQCRVRA